MPFGHIVYSNRNRSYHPRFGRFLQMDPISSGLPSLATIPIAGMSIRVDIDRFDLGIRSLDSASAYAYLGSSPWNRFDPLGLSWIDDAWEAEKRGLQFLAGASDPGGMIGSMYQSLMTQYSANLEADVDWAMDWSMPDDLYSRMDDKWVMLSLVLGAASHFGLDSMLDDGMGEYDEEDGSWDEGTNGHDVAYTKTPKHVGPVKGIKISRKLYKRNVALYRAKKWQLWADEVKLNHTKYASNALKRFE